LIEFQEEITAQLVSIKHNQLEILRRSAQSLSLEIPELCTNEDLLPRLPVTSLENYDSLNDLLKSRENIVRLVN